MYRSRGIKTDDDAEIADVPAATAAGEGGIASLPPRGTSSRDVPRSHVRP